jgi:hypothetical protein
LDLREREKRRKGKLRNFHSEELHNLCCSPNFTTVMKSKKLIWVGHVAHTEEMRNAYKILILKAGDKRPLRRLKRGWEDNIEIDLKEIWTCFIRLRMGSSDGLL